MFTFKSVMTDESGNILFEESDNIYSDSLEGAMPYTQLIAYRQQQKIAQKAHERLEKNA